MQLILKKKIVLSIYLVLTLFTFSILFSCKSLKNEEYKVINHFLDDEETYEMLYNTSKDSANLLFDSILISNNLIKNTELSHFGKALNWEYLYLNKERHLYSVLWNNKNERINLTEKEILYFNNQFNYDTNDFKLEQKNITVNNCIIVTDFFPLNINKFEFSYYKIKKNLPVYVISKPIFNKKKNIALMGLLNYSNESDSFNINVSYQLLIYKKINGKWNYYGYEEVSN